MDHVIDVGVADFAIGVSPQVLTAHGLGSCVAVCLYAPSKKIGALLHIMLSHAENEKLNPFRFVDTALPFILNKLHSMGISTEELEAHVAGGASMFAEVEDYLALGEKNTHTAISILRNAGIPIKTIDVGGNVGRNLEFSLETGNIKIITKV